ncbi:glycosyltransferase family 61 protein [Acetobacter indonesiensis]|uniref:glycosyltransferase family 61 protein n=1 Tax=Acetobacter indonesiensis TaxID=104101 RepID=UPI000A3B5ADF|nr:glycosyltransferase 61 family protein [Acetobacter indonesiensis]
MLDIRHYSSPIDFNSGIGLFSEPDVSIYNNAFYICGWNYFDNLHGVYTQEGYLIPHATFFNQWPPVPKGQTVWSDPHKARSFARVDCGIFVGHLHPQYGHFITECISRLWYLEKINKSDLKIIVRGIEKKEELFKIKWFLEIINILELKPENFFVPDTPVVFKTLIVPAPLFSEDSVCFSRMATFCNAIGSKFSQERSQELQKQRNIYLSRSKLSCGTVFIENEKELESELQKKGFEIVHPQDLTVNEQINIFRNDNFVIGQVGSAFHTSIFVPSPQGICFRTKKYDGKGTPPSVSYLLMDQVNGSAFDYLDMPSLVDSDNPNGNFIETRKIENLQLVLDLILQRFRDRTENFFLSNMGTTAIAEDSEIEVFELYSHDNKRVVSDSKTGLASTYEEADSTFPVMLVCGKDVLNKNVAFLISSHRDALSLSIDNTKLYGPAIPVIITKLSNEMVALKSLENNAYIYAGADMRGQNLRAEGPQIMAWEKYKILKNNLHIKDRSSRRTALISLISMVYFKKNIKNFDYYESNHKEIMKYVMSLNSIMA